MGIEVQIMQQDRKNKHRVVLDVEMSEELKHSSRNSGILLKSLPLCTCSFTFFRNNLSKEILSIFVP